MTIEYRRNSISEDWKTVPVQPGHGAGTDGWAWAKKINAQLGWTKYRQASSTP